MLNFQTIATTTTTTTTNYYYLNTGIAVLNALVKVSKLNLLNNRILGHKSTSK
jgi:hypothetical protein